MQNMNAKHETHHILRIYAYQGIVNRLAGSYSAARDDVKVPAGVFWLHDGWTICTEALSISSVSGMRTWLHRDHDVHGTKNH